MRTLPRRISLIVILVLLQSSPGTALAQSPPSDGINIERSRQESIYHGRGEQRPAGYVIDRSLTSYGDALADGFIESLYALGPQDRWLDIGAGQGLAVLDYYMPTSQKVPATPLTTKARAVAMSIEDRRTPRWEQTASLLGTNQLQYLYNKRLREYSAQEIGKFQLISDVIGGFSYTEDLSLFMEKVLDMLALNGSFFSVMQDVRFEQGTNKPHYAGAPFLTEIKNAGGTDMGICAWLKSISCVEVSCQQNTEWVPPLESYRVRKTCDKITVPKLERVHYVAGTPPEREFRLMAPAPAVPAPQPAASPAR